MKFNHTAHKELWNWLADNPEKEKEEWPGWLFNGGQYASIINYCFACAYSFFITNGGVYDFHTCPLIWPNHSKKREDEMCHYECWYSGGELGSWENAETTELKSWYARQIANLPVREGVECE